MARYFIIVYLWGEDGKDGEGWMAEEDDEEEKDGSCVV